MSTEYQIVDQPLPLSQDFSQLKEQGRAYLQAHMNYTWTNLNSSDPGITILDQLCYALTELGYCNDFPVQDILTRPDGQLQIANQFYLPEDILTTSPVTRLDYRKYLIDAVEGVQNAIVLNAKGANGMIPQTYQVYLLIDASVADANVVCQDAFAHLSDARNAGELFLMPQGLLLKNVSLSGTIVIDNQSQLETILVQADQAIRDYIFPSVVPQGYSTLVDNGLETNEIFNGPRLKTGWIPDTAPGDKKDLVSVMELIPVINAVSGVDSVSSLMFLSDSTVPVQSLRCNSNEMFNMSLSSSFKNGQLQIWCNSKQLTWDDLPSLTSAPDSPYNPNILFGAEEDVQTDIPKGKYRDIATYYSIQNTFPDIYGLADDTATSTAPSYEVAQSRQLKGYLTLFDQVLANQFSQLANVDKLFSFRNAMTGTPGDRYSYYAAQDKLNRRDREYPVPYLRFSPTYFYQSLYHVPYIRPLLQGNETFRFSLEQEEQEVMDNTSWEKYKLDPYNAYIHGLAEIMEQDNVSLHRRNEILDHLLARHGESPLMIDAYIEGSFYTRERIKDKVIFKSLYLQNFGLLSYNRYKGYNYISADKIVYRKEEKEYELPEITQEVLDSILQGDTVDFVFNGGKIDRIEKLEEKDFVNYSGLELKLNLLFGLRTVYRDFILKAEDVYAAPDNNRYQQLALWFIQKRRGCIMVEMPLLLQSLNYGLVIANPAYGKSWMLNGETDSALAATIISTINGLSSAQLDAQLNTSTPELTTDSGTYTFTALTPAQISSPNFHPVKRTGYSYLVKVMNPENKEQTLELADFNRRLEFLLPGFVELFSDPAFTHRLAYFLDNEVPVSIPYHAQVVKQELVGDLVSAFILWHESLRTGDLNHYPHPGTAICAWNLLNKIMQSQTPAAS